MYIFGFCCFKINTASFELNMDEKNMFDTFELY